MLSEPSDHEYATSTGCPKYVLQTENSEIFIYMLTDTYSIINFSLPRHTTVIVIVIMPECTLIERLVLLMSPQK